MKKPAEREQRLRAVARAQRRTATVEVTRAVARARRRRSRPKVAPGKTVRKIWRGVMAPAQRRTLAMIGAYTLRRHNDPADPFTLPNYRHPQGRRMARELRKQQEEARANG